MFDSSLDIERAFGEHTGMGRTRVRRRRTALTAAGLVLAAVIVGPVGHVFEAGAAPRSARSVLVRPGDTLWSIAERSDPGSDPRSVIETVIEANALESGSLQPGQRLVVPAP